MKKTKKIFVYAICILLSALIASATLMAGATDAAVAEQTSVTEKTTVPSTAVVTTTEKDITDVIVEIVSKNELQDDLSEIGNGIKSFSEKMADFLNDCIKAIETAGEKIVEFLKQVFRLGTFD